MAGSFLFLTLSTPTRCDDRNGDSNRGNNDDQAADIIRRMRVVDSSEGGLGGNDTYMPPFFDWPSLTPYPPVRCTMETTTPAASPPRGLPQ